jgi:hypothetical protein
LQVIHGLPAGTIIGLSSFGNRAYRHEIHD